MMIYIIKLSGLDCYVLDFKLGGSLGVVITVCSFAVLVQLLPRLKVFFCVQAQKAGSGQCICGATVTRKKLDVSPPRTALTTVATP